MVGVRWQEEISRGKGSKRDPHSLIGSLMYDVEYCIICEEKKIVATKESNLVDKPKTNTINRPW